MGSAEITRRNLQPYFDLEEYMALCQETRLDGKLYEQLGSLWERWLPLLQVREIKVDGKSILAVWLPEEVEREVDELFDRSPSQGFMINNLAQYICMAAIAEMLPAVAQGNCAPSPEPGLALTEALEEAGLPCRPGATILPDRRYATITWYPFRGGCEVCSMQDNCPKGHNYSIVLPGHEKSD